MDLLHDHGPHPFLKRLIHEPWEADRPWIYAPYLSSHVLREDSSRARQNCGRVCA